jgi:hypothetical protein
MVTRLSKQGTRRYRSFGASLALVTTFASIGVPPASGTPTVVRRRYPQVGRTLALVKTLDSLGSPSGGSSGGTAGFSRSRVVNNGLCMDILKQATARNKMVFLVDAVDHVTGKAGLALTVTASKDGGAFATITPTITDRGAGWYNLALTSAHTDTLGDFALHITASNADPCDLLAIVEVDRTGATVTGVTGNVTGSVGSIAGITFPTNFAVLAVDANGRIKPLTGVTKNAALNNFMFLMTDAGTHAPKVGLGSAVTGTVSIDGGPFTALTNSVAETSGGYYKVNLAAADVNGSVIALRFTGAAADDTDISFVTSG